MSWSNTLADYVAQPTSFWPEDRPLQANKLEEMVQRQCSALGLTAARLVETIIGATQARADAGTPTLFLINCGSSGSHWLEAMLAAAIPDVRPCGEVYIPPVASERLAGQPTAQGCFADGLHQLHMEPCAPAGPRDILINSAHSWGPHDAMPARAVSVFLVRDPLDVVASRTFRKPKLRRHLNPTSSDVEYLDKNIAFVTKFYRSALRRKPRHIVRYEDLRSRPEQALGALANLLGRPVGQDALAEVARTYSAEGQARSGARLSNTYRGNATAPEGLLAEAAEKLQGLRRELDYR